MACLMTKRDDRGNTALHYAYDFDQPEIRSLLKENGLSFKNARNWRGLVPCQQLHDYFFDDSLSESEDEEAEGFMSLEDYRAQKMKENIKTLQEDLNKTVQGFFRPSSQADKMMSEGSEISEKKEEDIDTLKI